MALPSIPAGITVREMAHWRLRASTFTPGRALDGRQQYISVENRTWEVEYGVIGAWDNLMGQWIAFLDEVGGPRRSFLVPVRNDLTLTYDGDLAAFQALAGATPTQIAEGFLRFSDGTAFSDGTGFALPSPADPTVQADTPAGASRITLGGFFGTNLAVGAYFAIDNFLHRVQSNSAGDILFNPPLRADATAGTTAVVSGPMARVRFPDDAAWRQAIEIRRYYGPYRMTLVEAFDR